MKRNAKALSLILMNLVLLAGCNGNNGDISASSEPPPAAATPPGGGGQQDDGGDEPADLQKIASQLNPQTWLDQQRLFNDTDGDGVQDAFDTEPQKKPLMSDPRSNQALSIDAAWSVIDGRRIDDVALQGYPLLLSVSGLPTSNNNSIWVSFQTGAGYRAVRAKLTVEGLLEVFPEADALGAHVIVGSSRGLDRTLRSLSLGEPVMFSPDQPVVSGSTLDIEGRDLASVTEVTLSGEVLTVEEKTASTLSVVLPPSARGNRLVATTDVARSNVLELDLRQDVTISVASDLPLSNGQALRLRSGGELYRIVPNTPQTISVAAHRPATLYFDVVDVNGNVQSYGVLQAVSWPGNSRVDVSVHSTLLSRLMSIRNYLPGVSGSDWNSIRQSFEQSFTTPEAQDYLVKLTDFVAGRSAPPEDRLVSAVARAYERIVATNSVGLQKKDSEVTTGYFDPTTSTLRKLDDVIASTVDDPDPDGQAVRQTFGNENSQVTVLRHADRNITVPNPLGGNLFSIGGCIYSPNEVQWRESHAVATASQPYRALWRSDLCLQLDGKVVLSAAVFKPAGRDPDTILNEMSQAAFASQNPPEVLRRHSRASFADTAYQFTSGEFGGYYLRGDDGTPLCHMETCYIEVITSGLGLFTTTQLSPTQKEIARTLRMRMWLDVLVPWLIGLAEVDGDSNREAIGSCYLNSLIADPKFRDAIDRLATRLDRDSDKIKANPVTELGAALNATVSDWARKYMTGQIGTDAFKCITDVAVAAVAPDDIETRVKAKWPESKKLFAFLQILEFVQDLGSAVLTPERFVFKVEPVASIHSVSPMPIDVLDTDKTLVIEGDWLASTDSNAPAPCLGKGWCPRLVVRDRYGTEAEVQFIETDIKPAQNCGFACTRLELPFSSLTLPNLVGGAVDIELAIDDLDGDAYASYPGGKLRVPVPGDSERLRALPGLAGVNPPLMEAGDDITVIGSRLSEYGAEAIWGLRSPADPDVFYYLPVIDQSIDSDSEIRLRVPKNVPGGLYAVTADPDVDQANSLPPLETPDLILVTNDPLPLIAVGDQGVDKDDTIRIELLDVNGNQVFVQGQLTRPFRSTIPFLMGNGQTEAYSVALSWSDATDSLGELLDITALVRQVAVTCIDAGNDNLCSYGLSSARDRVCLTEGSPATPFQARKIPEGRTDFLRLARPTPNGPDDFESCQEAFNNP